MIHSILTRLGFQFEASDSGLMISVPSWRATKDINIREDIAEEIARISGYDNIVEKPLTGTITIAKRNVLREIERRAQRHFSLL
jgi:phenylalanyl-tRNA synthetase beta chain